MNIIRTSIMALMFIALALVIPVSETSVMKAEAGTKCGTYKRLCPVLKKHLNKWNGRRQNYRNKMDLLKKQSDALRWEAYLHMKKFGYTWQQILAQWETRNGRGKLLMDIGKLDVYKTLFKRYKKVKAKWKNADYEVKRNYAALDNCLKKLNASCRELQPIHPNPKLPPNRIQPRPKPPPGNFKVPKVPLV